MIEITKENLQELALLVRDELIKTSQGVGDGDVDIVNTLSNINSLLAYQKSGAICKIVEAPLTLLQVGVQRSETHLQWRVGNEVWKDVILLADLMGKDFKFSDFTPEQLALLTLTFDKLTPAEKDSLKLKFSDLTATDIIALQKPAVDAAKRADEKMVQISEDVNQTREKLVEDAGKVNTDLTTAVKGLEERAETVISETNTVKEAAEEAVINADNATTAANGAAGLANTAAKDTNKATELAVVAAKLAGEKAEQASTSADKADTAAGSADDAAALANEKATLANNAAGVADTATGKANTAIGNAETATKRANDAAAAAEGIVSGVRPDWAAGRDSPNYIKNKPEIPTLQVAPGTDTISYVNTDGTLTTYRIGDEVRVLEDDEYVFYRLYDLSEDVASWQESGSGTALPGNIYLQGATYYNKSVRIIKGGYLNEQ